MFIVVKSFLNYSNGHSDLHFLTLTAKNVCSWDSKYHHHQKPNFRFFGFSSVFGIFRFSQYRRRFRFRFLKYRDIWFQFWLPTRLYKKLFRAVEISLHGTVYSVLQMKLIGLLQRIGSKLVRAIMPCWTQRIYVTLLSKPLGKAKQNTDKWCQVLTTQTAENHVGVTKLPHNAASCRTLGCSCRVVFLTLSRSLLWKIYQHLLWKKQSMYKYLQTISS